MSRVKTMVSERLQALRERIQRREKRVRAGRRASSRRVEREEPEGARETAGVKSRQARQEAEMTAEEARNLATDAKQLISTELGISRNEAEGVIEQSADLVRTAGDSLDDLDFDGDGDSDVLNLLDAEGEVGLVDKDGGDRGDGSIGIGASDEIFDPFEEGPR